MIYERKGTHTQAQAQAQTRAERDDTKRKELYKMYLVEAKPEHTARV